MIDTHTHLYLPEFDHDRAEMISRAVEAGINRFYLPAIDSLVAEDMFALELQFPAHCFAMMGLHPCSVKENFREELILVKEWLVKRKFAAVGEIGLDFYWDKAFIDQQYTAFNEQMQLAVDHELPIVIHSRNATQESIDVVKPFVNLGLKGIFHCFGGTKEQAEEITGLGFMLGIGGVLTYKNSGLDKVIETISMEYIVLETDAPYLAPQPFRGKRNESSYIKYVATRLAEIKGITVEEVDSITTANAIKIFENR